MIRKIYFSRTNKYNSKKSKYGDRIYDSALEASYAQDLDWMKKAGEVKQITPQFKLSLDINGTHIANYFMDFKVEFTDGRIEMHEVKGYETEVWRMKWKIAIAVFPEYNFVLIK